MAFLTVRKNLLESSKFLLSIRKFLLRLFQEKDFLFQAKICFGRFFVSKKWLIWRTSKILLEKVSFTCFKFFFLLKIRIALFAVFLDCFQGFSYRSQISNFRSSSWYFAGLYLAPCPISKMKFFCEKQLSGDMLHFRCLTRF